MRTNKACLADTLNPTNIIIEVGTIIMRINYSTIGRKIMTIRKKNGLSQMTFSEAIGKSPAYVSYIETGKKSMSLDTFVRIANTLCVSPDLLLAEQLMASAVPASQELTYSFERLQRL